MQFLSAKTLLYARVVFIIIIAYYLVKDPEALSTAGFVVLLGQAMQVPLIRLQPTDTLTGFCAVIMAGFSIGDLIPLLANNVEYFDTLVPVRLAAYFGLAAYCYFVNDSPVSNSLIFTFSFFEIWFNFLIYNNLKDEKYYRVKKYIEEHSDEIRDAYDEEIRIVEVE
ncbi:uncharacterized protein CANTADRAFT_27218 [Suhomyces tanzawaensis NRRL Y-17324]|uniref:Protein ILM1 n=1 Tax=Suhomyces tanzawaensis NRRL Y-17324 TaxID=984487 RepID=A0A1E4SD02_9ASCO|nr:uncharacterized protein CANTADRAFT_27218 [Suhomyces tanzawaensis NRRL Y-17324]ODV77363.1 hypothetical protein CANTADRAFT_27218 [Suhomyces tanzawaensis NRRL Y-17324]